MVKPELKDFGLTEESIISLKRRIKKTSDLLEYTIPVTLGAVLGLIIYTIYYHPFSNPDLFQISVSIFAFGGFGVLFMGIPLMFFHVFSKAYMRKLKESSKEFNDYMRYKYLLNLYEQWALRNDPEFWKNLDTMGLIYEISGLLIRTGFTVLSRDKKEYKEFDMVINKDFKTMPVFFITSNKKTGINKVRKIYSDIAETGINSVCIYSTSGFTRHAIKYVQDNDIILLTPEYLISINQSIE